MSEPQKLAKLFTVQGKLRRVGYRFFTKTCADALGVTGWVRHAREGVVEAHAEGTPQQLEEFRFDLSRGARYARVESVESTDVPVEGLDGFKVQRGYEDSARANAERS